MIAKLCPDVLDKFDIFVIEIEELEIPKVIKMNTATICNNSIAYYNLIVIQIK